MCARSLAIARTVFETRRTAPVATEHDRAPFIVIGWGGAAGSLGLMPIDILTVYTGNIVRSPLSALYLRLLLADLPVEVASAGTHRPRRPCRRRRARPGRPQLEHVRDVDEPSPPRRRGSRPSHARRPALVRSLNAALLFTGDDFAQTDLPAAI